MIRILFLLLCFTLCSPGLWAQPALSGAVVARIGAPNKRIKADSITLVVRNPTGQQLSVPHRMLHRYRPAGLALVRMGAQHLEQLRWEQQLHYVDLAYTPKEEITTGSMDISLNRLNYAHQQFPGIRGKGIQISLKEQRFDTGDIDFRNRYFLTGAEAPTNTTHASLMATIAAGAGNSSPQATGAAPASRLHSSSFFNLLPDEDSLFLQQRISVQNHSYGTIVENRYGLEAMAYDLQVWNNPTLLHVFSSGNSGTAAGAGPYAGLAGRANLTGNFKYAKNVLTVGAVDSFGQVAPLSSRGPSFDGRIKPEIVAFGEDGSSGAAALVSGTAALVQQSYRERFGLLPPAALVKAVLINSAASPHENSVSHRSGWGNLDGWAALKTIGEGRCITATVNRGAQTSMVLHIPENTRLVKITISWTDTAATVETAKALVNDVDALLRHPANGQQWRPWVLSAHPDSLDYPAVRGMDTVNNTEQISLLFPEAGQYQLVLDGSKLKAATQQVAVAWQTENAGVFLFTYPAAGQALEIGKAQLIRWQTGVQGTGTLQWAEDGKAWQNIAADIPLDRGACYWVPGGKPVAGRLRMLIANNEFFTSEPFLLSNTTALSVGFQCADSVLLTWRAAGAEAYQLYQLGNQYMEPLNTVRDTFVVVRPPAGSSGIYSIAPLVAGMPAVRSAALNIAGSGTGCYIRGFFVQEQTDNWVALRAQLGTTFGLSEIRLQQWVPGSGFTTIQSMPAGNPDVRFTDSSLLSGINRYRLEMVLHNGGRAFSELLDVYHFVQLPVLVYPNPVARNSSFTLVTQLAGKYSVEMFDLHGKRVGIWALQDQFTVVPARYNAGLYLLRIRSDEGTEGVTKLVIY
jgi:hypothetical protein